MPVTLPLPDWIPWWGQLAIIVVAILFGLAFLMVPFAVFGLKGRLDFLEAQLDDIHAELRMLAMRLPDLDHRPVRPKEAEPVVQEIRPERPRLTREPPLATEPRRPRPADDWSTPPPMDDDVAQAPRRPLRAGPPRDPGPSRSEPTVRWPPR